MATASRRRRPQQTSCRHENARPLRSLSCSARAVWSGVHQRL